MEEQAGASAGLLQNLCPCSDTGRICRAGGQSGHEVQSDVFVSGKSLRDRPGVFFLRKRLKLVEYMYSHPIRSDDIVGFCPSCSLLKSAGMAYPSFGISMSSRLRRKDDNPS